MEEMEVLIQEAKSLGIPNPTLYRLLPENKQTEALKKDIEKVKQSTPADE